MLKRVSPNFRAGFTIVELLVVIAIISILAGAITMGVNGMFYKTRFARANAMRSVLQSGLETYYARKGKWPKAIQDASENSKKDSVELSASETDECFREIVRVSVGASASPVLDPSGLFVLQNAPQDCCVDIHNSWDAAVDHGVVSASDRRCAGKCRRGRNFADATKKGAPSRIPISQMSFGYAGPNHGNFCRYRIVYSPKADTVRVYGQKALEHQCRSGEHDNGYTDD